VATPSVAAADTQTKAATTPVVASTQAPANIGRTDSSPAAVSPSAANVALETSAAEKSYDAEIGRLRAVVAARRATLDTATINVIDRNLKVIDDAIAQCRAALRKDPASRFLMQSLDDALTTKVQLLRTAASLPARA
jgi:hypothetical protein